MSKKRALQKMAQQTAQAQIAASARRAFTVVIAFDPARPQTANINIMPVGGDGNGGAGAHIDDVVTALRMSYEQAVMQKGAFLFQQQAQKAGEESE